jgi:hypothetical protein
MYAELIRNYKKQRIKSLCDNKFAYVNYGHKQTKGRYVPALGKQLKKGWVVGQFMMEKSEKNIQEIAPKVLEAKLKKFLEECMG